MREILFRGQTQRKGEKIKVDGTPADGCWVYGGIFPANGVYSVIYTLDPITKCSVYSDTVGQYTGLTDKNGTKIFEGDIINIPIGKRVMYTYWNEETMQWELADVGSELSVINHTINCFALSELQLEWCYEGEASYEVISNIHDTPKQE